MMIARVVMLLYKDAAGDPKPNPPRALNFAFVALTNSVEGYRGLAISIPTIVTVWPQCTGNTAEATRRQDKREKKR